MENNQKTKIKRKQYQSSKNMRLSLNHNLLKNVVPSLERPKELKLYSRSIVTIYKPLTEKQKMKEYEDIHNDSVKRMKNYYNIFEKIKNELSNISIDLDKANGQPSSRETSSRKNYNSTIKNKLNLNLNNNCIQETEDEDIFSPPITSKQSKYISQTVANEENYDDNFDDDSLECVEEEKNKFEISQFPVLLTLGDIRQTNKEKGQTRRMKWFAKSMMLQKEKKSKVKRSHSTKNKKENFDKEFYGEPVILATEINTINNNQIIQNNTCHCLAF